MYALKFLVPLSEPKFVFIVRPNFVTLCYARRLDMSTVTWIFSSLAASRQAAVRFWTADPSSFAAMLSVTAFRRCIPKGVHRGPPHHSLSLLHSFSAQLEEHRISAGEKGADTF